MYKLTSNTESRRVYRNEQTGTEVVTVRIYTDGDEQRWWAFEDLLNIPFIRKKASEKTTQLYGAGLTKDDIDAFIEKQKATLKSNDPEKYERAYSELLQFQLISEKAADVVKQSLALCCVYILSDEERIDVFSYDDAAKKIARWEVDVDAQAFFLQWLTAGMNAYTALSSSISQIASQVAKG